MQQKTRISWPDYVKGIAILLVVLGHLIYSLKLVDADATLPNVRSDFTFGQYLIEWIYAFHMQAFFFISGLLSQISNRTSAKSFLTAKLRTIVYPYFVWSTIQISLMLAMAGKTTHKVSWQDLFTQVYHPIMQFWFLYALFAMLLIFALLRKLKFSPVAILACSILLYCFTPLLPEGIWGPINWVCQDMIYFGFGVALSHSAITMLPKLSNEWLAVSAIGCTVLLTLGVYYMVPLESPGNNIDIEFLCLFAVTPLLALLGIGMLCATGELLSRSERLDVLRRYGVVSLQIYVAHTMAMAAIRIILSKVLKVENIWIHIGAGMMVGVYFPLVLWWLCQRFKFPYLFMLPEPHHANNP